MADDHYRRQLLQTLAQLNTNIVKLTRVIERSNFMQGDREVPAYLQRGENNGDNPPNRLAGSPYGSVKEDD